jgi:hypothetical protein
MTDIDLSTAEVEREHLAEVHVRAQWAYLAGVIGLGAGAMLLLIAWLGSA